MRGRAFHFHRLLAGAQDGQGGFIALFGVTAQEVVPRLVTRHGLLLLQTRPGFGQLRRFFFAGILDQITTILLEQSGFFYFRPFQPPFFPNGCQGINLPGLFTFGLLFTVGGFCLIPRVQGFTLRAALHGPAAVAAFFLIQCWSRRHKGSQHFFQLALG